MYFLQALHRFGDEAFGGHTEGPGGGLDDDDAQMALSPTGVRIMPPPPPRPPPGRVVPPPGRGATLTPTGTPLRGRNAGGGGGGGGGGRRAGAVATPGRRGQGAAATAAQGAGRAFAAAAAAGQLPALASATSAALAADLSRTEAELRGVAAERSVGHLPRAKCIELKLFFLSPFFPLLSFSRLLSCCVAPFSVAAEPLP